MFLEIEYNGSTGNDGKMNLSITSELDINVFIKLDTKLNSIGIEPNSQSTKYLNYANPSKIL